MEAGTDASFSGVGVDGRGVGQLRMLSTGVEWRDRLGVAPVKIERAAIERLSWGVFGGKAQMKVQLGDGGFYRMDGFAKADHDKMADFCRDVYGIELGKEQVASAGGNFGDVELVHKSLVLRSDGGANVLEMKLDHVAQCVIPTNNRDEIEIQFHELDGGVKEADSLVQITLHLADEEEEEEDEEVPSSAERLQQQIMSAGVIQSATGNVIVDFSKEQGTFVTPRGRYSVQMTSSYFRMQGAQYDYKILYTDIAALFLLPKPDDVRTAFVISLEKPIRQGNQKYQHLVLETHRLDHTIAVNLTEEEIASKYDGQLSAELTMPMCNLFAKVFKVLSQSTVFVPKHFVSERKAHCVKCSLKASEGLLYPLAKSFIFIHKPTLIIRFEDIESIEFQRYKANAMSGATHTNRRYHPSRSRAS